MKQLKPNIGLVNSFLRLTAGFTMLAWGTAKLVKRPYSSSPLIIAMMGAMKVAEGITRFCPLTFFMEQNNQQAPKDDQQIIEQIGDMISPE